jgi:hypothetical protein
MLARLDKPLRLTRGQDGKGENWGRTIVAIALDDESCLDALNARPRGDTR